MTTPTTVTIGGIDYAPVSKPSEVVIAVLQRGNVVVGRITRDGDEITLTDAHVVRYWGTTNGLGEIALDGPTSKTKLDKAGTVRFHALTVVMLIDCTAERWSL